MTFHNRTFSYIDRETNNILNFFFFFNKRPRQSLIEFKTCFDADPFIITGLSAAIPPTISVSTY